MASVCLTYIIQKEVATPDGYCRILVDGKQIYSEKVAMVAKTKDLKSYYCSFMQKDENGY